MKTLNLRDVYSRKEIHHIFSPETTFTPQAGTWGLHGIIKIPNTDSDYVFIVTYGQSQGEHDFDEGITEDGVLSWQSQPRQDLQNKVIQQLIAHNDLTDNIYLFLRENKKDDYEYLGRLAYLEHDIEREKPVYFQWQLSDWDELITPKERITTPKKVVDETPKPTPVTSIRETNERPSKKRQGITRELFRARKSPDYAAKDAKNRQLGLEGELLVLEHEINKLEEAGCPELAAKVIHTSVVQGDGAGYDIKSFNQDGSARYIEVKSTRGSLNTDFYMSPNERKFAEKNADNFYLYRVYDLGNQQGEALFYVLAGDINEQLDATPVSFKMSFKQ
jgi:hypothetical protein|tara:strand:+ start:414 stop:1412 length:999 start_codon:yes stop_codon:yes gene_type:complete